MAMMSNLENFLSAEVEEGAVVQSFFSADVERALLSDPKISFVYIWDCALFYLIFFQQLWKFVLMSNPQFFSGNVEEGATFQFFKSFPEDVEEDAAV